MDSKNQYLIEDKSYDQSHNSQMNYQQQGVMYPPQQQQMNYPQQPQMHHHQQPQMHHHQYPQLHQPQQGGVSPPQMGIPIHPQQGVMQPPQQGGVYNPPQMGQPQAIHNHENIPNNSNQSAYPVIAKCPNCKEVSTTVVSNQTGAHTWIMAGILCLISCCCIPFCVDSCQDKVHRCPKCTFIIGVNEYKILK